MKKRAGVNIKTIIVLMYLFLTSSCKTYKETYIMSEDKDYVMFYKEESDCSLYKLGYLMDVYKHYSPKKCFKIRCIQRLINSQKHPPTKILSTLRPFFSKTFFILFSSYSL